MGDCYTPKERLLRTLAKQPQDRQPLICPGGMMNAAVVELMEKTGHTLPAAHHEGGLMADLAFAVYEQTGFENFGLPFCMTIEAEALGSAVDYGSLSCEPKIQQEAFSSLTERPVVTPKAIEKTKRAAAVLEAIHRLSRTYPDIPVIASITGPVSTAASLIAPMTFLKELYRNKAEAHCFLNRVTDELVQWAQLLADTGARVIAIADPTATGEILGPKLFEEYALPALKRLLDALHAMGVPVIVHICGDVRQVKAQLCRLHSDALSVDAMVNLEALKKEAPTLTTMGNLSTYLLQSGTPDTVQARSRALLKKHIDIIAPACGLSTSTPLANIRAFTEAVRHG